MIDDLTILIGKQPDYSFPSGHTGVTFAFAAAMLFALIFGIEGFPKSKRFVTATLLVMFYALLLGFSRLYVGVHYPTDVLSGMVLGFTTGALGYVIEKRVRRAWEKKHPV